MIGFRVVNLLLPGDPQTVTIVGLNGDWVFTAATGYAAAKDAILTQHKSAETYLAVHPASHAAGAAVLGQSVDEMLSLCLGATYATGHAVTMSTTTQHSAVQFFQVGEHFPRERSWAGVNPVVNDEHEFKTLLEAFLHGYRAFGRREKAILLVHHWLDSLSCWSLEDLYLSATTVLQTIAATEMRTLPIPKKKKPSFFKYVAAAANRYGLPVLSHDFKNMRNDLIHDGTLSGTSYSGKAAEDCRAVAVAVLNWIDLYLHAALGLGPVRRVRFDPHSLDGLNAYSL
ncbi:hypothetical protein J0H58_11965 [bacterium]|nr:hypothetical protein [bacterium]